jgi:tripartite-type tricarboxylate transporter receptor subunit TctC
MTTDRSRLTLLALAALLAAAGAAQAAESEEAFFKGKQLKIVAGSTPGDSYDAYSRMMAEYMPRHIPGHPTMIVQNMPGAAGSVAAGSVYNTAPRDGTVLGLSVSGVPTAGLLADAPVQFDVTKMIWLGSVTKDPFVGFVWHTSPVQTLAEMKTKEVLMGGLATTGSASVEYTAMAKEIFGFPFKLISGYNSTPEIKLATERGEIAGSLANSWSSFKLTAAEWLREKKVSIFVQFGFTKHPDLPNVPQFVDEAKTDTQKQILKLMLGRQEYAKSFYLPPGVPEARVAVFRQAFDDTIKDPEFLDAMKKANLDVVSSMHWHELTQLITEINQTPPAVVAQIRDVLARARAK